MPIRLLVFVAVVFAGVAPRAQEAPVKADKKAARPAPLTKEQVRLAALKKDAIANVDAWRR